MSQTRMKYKWIFFCLSSTIIFAVLLAGCGGAASPTAITSSSQHSSLRNTSSSDSTSRSLQSSGGSQNSLPSQVGPQYLIKALRVGLAVKDTRKTADELQAWISKTDQLASSTSINYDSIGDNLFNISMSFSVQASIYPQIVRYLRDYAPQQQGRLTDFNESVQDVTNNYIDTQSRLKNLHTEQDRLLALLSHAQALSDVLTIEQRLTDVEGQIESMEAQFKALSDQVTFYTISINLQPIDSAPPLSNSSWNVGQIFHDAFAASLGFAQALVAFLIWLLAFSFYIVPAILIIWLFIKWRHRSGKTAPLHTPSMYTPTPPPSANL